MKKTKKLIILFMLLSCFFIIISSASAADFRVKQKTSHDDITKWMKKAKKGDNLIFTSSNYTLTDGILISKDITVRSTKNTKIHYNKNKTMFYVIANKVTFSHLTLNHNGQGSVEFDQNGNLISRNIFAVVSASKDTTAKKIDFYKVKINAKKSYVLGIDIPLWNGSVRNSRINLKGHEGSGIKSEQWTGNLVNSYVSTTGTFSVAVRSVYWSGNVKNSKIYNTAIFHTGGVPTGLLFPFGKGTISKTLVKVPNGTALRLDKNIKVTACSLFSKKGFTSHYKFLPDLSLNIKKIKRSGNTYSIKVYNNNSANQFGSSKQCHLGVKIGKYVKTVKVKPLTFGQSTTVKVTIPKKYVSKKYTKIVKVDYYNKIKEEFKDNNIVRFNYI